MSTDERLEQDPLATPSPLGGPDAGQGAPAEPDAPRRGRGAGVAVFVGVLAVSVGAVGLFLVPRGTSSSTQIGDEALPADPIGAVAPDFTAASNDGQGSISLSQYRGKPVVLNFWASWCTTCIDEAALLGEAEKTWAKKGVVFLGVDVRDTPDGAKKFQDTYGIGYRSVSDTDARLQSRYRVTGLPETFFIGADGKVTAKYISAIDRATLDKLITEQVAASKAART